jgi:hypothetical protein
VEPVAELVVEPVVELKKINLWTPIVVDNKAPVYVNPVSYMQKAYELHKIAVDEIYSKLIWPDDLVYCFFRLKTPLQESL